MHLEVWDKVPATTAIKKLVGQRNDECLVPKSSWISCVFEYWIVVKV